jgi:S1-C subfamily serine protease
MWSNDMEQVELYLDGRLNGEQIENFEARLQADGEFLQLLLETKKMKDALSFYGERKTLKNRLDIIHGELFKASDMNAINPVKTFFISHYKTMAVAASVSLLVAISAIFYTQFNKAQNTQTANFKAMRKDVERIKKSQHVIINNMNAIKVEKPAANYSGTGFALSTDGFFITSLHVIKGADSVFIQKNKGELYKAVTFYRNEAIDIAILKVVSADFKPYHSLPYQFKTKSIGLGEKVFTLGYPREDIVYGEGSLSSASGFEGDTSSYQISIPVNPGNSGAPLLDEKGNIIGLLIGKQTESEGAAFAVKSQSIIRIIESIQKDSLGENFKLPSKNTLSNLSRVNQLKQLNDYIVNVKVYEHN